MRIIDAVASTWMQSFAPKLAIGQSRLVLYILFGGTVDRYTFFIRLYRCVFDSITDYHAGEYALRHNLLR